MTTADADVESAYGEILPRAFFDRPVLEIAPDLLGRILVRRLPDAEIALRLTEVEAYDGANDPGSHAYRGRTPRNAVMFGSPGRVYVYFTYGMHYCMNLVCGPVGTARAVLLRAGGIIAGEDAARPRRPTARTAADLACGPARLTMALGVDRALDGTDACVPSGPLEIREGERAPAERIRTGPRTGVGGDAGLFPWRFWLADEPSVSPYRGHQPRRRTARLASGRPAE